MKVVRFRMVDIKIRPFMLRSAIAYFGICQWAQILQYRGGVQPQVLVLSFLYLKVLAHRQVLTFGYQQKSKPVCGLGTK